MSSIRAYALQGRGGGRGGGGGGCSQGLPTVNGAPWDTGLLDN